jgi:hypothetical protein
LFDKFNFVVPTRGRAKTRLPQFYDSVMSTASKPTRVCFTFVYDDDDCATMAYVMGKPNVFSVASHAVDRPHLAGLMNKGFDSTGYRGEDYVYGYFGDDFVSRTQGWDDIVLDIVNMSKGRRAVWGFDGYLNDLPTYYFMPDRLWQAMGTEHWVYPHAGMEMTDLITRDTLAPLGLLQHCPDLVFEHRHSSRPEVGADDTFNRLQTADNSKVTAKDVSEYIKKCQDSIKKEFKR